MPTEIHRCHPRKAAKTRKRKHFSDSEDDSDIREEMEKGGEDEEEKKETSVTKISDISEDDVPETETSTPKGRFLSTSFEVFILFVDFVLLYSFP